MKLPALSLRSRDRRALRVGGIVVLAYLGILGGQRYMADLGELHDQVALQRGILAREIGVLESGSSIDRDLQVTAAAFASRSASMFPAADSLAAVSDLSSYLLDLAEQMRVLIEHSEGRSSSLETPGLVTLMVMLRGRSDLEGLVAFLTALDAAPNLIRVEQLSITRLPSSPPPETTGAAPSPDVQVLEFSALVTGYALPPAADSTKKVD